MASVGTKDTAPELAVRRLLHSMGYRFRLHRRDLPGTPDIVLPRYEKAIFVHGCFWHGHAGCRFGRLPKSRLGYWAPKIAANRARDIRKATALRRVGWSVSTVWACETKDLSKLAGRLQRFIGA
jgi:DNA mismatch endonuclease, patch repair protein